MEYLSEDRIKKAGLRFLKSYYRQRERSDQGPTNSRYDVETLGGIIVDVHLSFLTPTGVPFQAAMEASSRLSKEEVTFQLQRKLLFWDSFAAGTLMTAIIFSYSYAFDKFTIDQIGLFPSVLLLLILIVFFGGVVALSVKWKNRYQYIYAIEQFKNYHVDEQWIAIGSDVFDHPEDVLFLELREQCVVNGFGLIEINHDEVPKLLITPSRSEIFGNRKSLGFGKRDSALQRTRVAKYKKVWNKSLGNRMTLPNREQLRRFKPSFLPQVMLSAFAFFLIGTVFHFELQQNEVVYMDEEDYKKEMLRFSETTFAELEEYVLDSAALAPIVEGEPGYLQLLSEEVVDVEATDYVEKYDVHSTEYDQQETEDVLEFEAIPDEPFRIIFATENGLQIRYDCTRLHNLNGRYYLVLDNLYQNPHDAQKRVARLTAADVPVNAFSMECFVDNDPRYLVYFDLFHPTQKATGVALRKYRNLLRKKGFSSKNVKTYSIEIKR
ncbi:MAG: hypothetical protein AB8F74_02925 [Saprospiraceae bacterium]